MVARREFGRRHHKRPLDAHDTPDCRDARGQLRRQLGTRRCWDRYDDRDLVFATDTGAPVNPSNLCKGSFEPLFKRAKLPRVRFHDPMHTCATLLISKGTRPKFVQKHLGHATTAITLDTYPHIVPGKGEYTVKAIEDALS